jgi:hypothetical protein
MSLRKRRSVWWIDIATPSGERIRRSAETGNKAHAQELPDKERVVRMTWIRQICDACKFDSRCASASACRSLR